MPEVIVDRVLDLTVHDVIEVFKKHLGGKYEIEEAYVPTRDFVVKRSGWTGVWVRMILLEDSVSFVFAPFMPSMKLQMVFAIGGLIAWQFLRRSWTEIENDVKTLLEQASEFK